MSLITLLPYNSSHKPRLLEILASNTPKYFNEDENIYFKDFLDQYADKNYFVIVLGNKIIGCGGYYTKDKIHGMPWVMFENNSLGSNRLLKVADEFYKTIETRILSEGKLFDIVINTTQLMEQLFNRYGFVTYEIIKDGFGNGLDEYKMKKVLK
ncbi:N-acetyltransferase [Aureibacter tunicatorum]|uniref:N-acetyltransferase domain-containing protein n=1 Tax=Aureibacter tunicatorum TaxID=866807 RepID=A0AAE4BPZ3_9BACT|nr:N-acetyltransferase [Aureibacter tunicatorum]MDR6237026.1 hypothetical protein [Aureibacter tunicatorum]BDD06018.1 hypothetical protein AUTU_35010 [Aureibacter tunicatorum]